MMMKAARKPGPESTLDDVRAKLVTAGIQLLRERGVDVGLAEVPLSDAIAAAGVTRSTAYRSLAHEDLNPQAALHRELLTYLLRRYNQGDAKVSIEHAVTEELARHEHALRSDDVRLRTAALRGVIRVGANASYQQVIESPERSILTAIYGALQSSPQSDWRRDALAEGEAGLTAMFTELYTQLADLFGYGPKPSFTMAQFTAAGASLLEGIAMRHGVNDLVTMIDRPTGPSGSPQAWSLFAISFEALFVGMCEPQNPTDPVADLLQY